MDNTCNYVALYGSESTTDAVSDVDLHELLKRCSSVRSFGPFKENIYLRSTKFKSWYLFAGKLENKNWWCHCYSWNKMFHYNCILFSRVSHAISSLIQREPSEWPCVPSCQQAAPLQRGRQGDPVGRFRGCGQSHSAEHKECCCREKMDPPWPSQPLQMELGSLKNWFPALSSSKVRPGFQVLSVLLQNEEQKCWRGWVRTNNHL